MTSTSRPMITLTRHAEVMAALGDPRYDVLAAPPAPRGLAWLRGAVSRFSHGDTHARRRALGVQLLSTATPAALRAAAATLARENTMRPRDVPVTVLARALAFRAPVVEQVTTVGAAYFGGATQDGQSEVDDALEALVASAGGIHDEHTAARIALLVQAHDATGGLVANTLAALDRFGPRQPLAAVVAETLRHDPPVPSLRREALSDADLAGHGAVAARTVIVLDVATANRDPAVFADPERFDAARPGLEHVLTFGAGLRPCPGRNHALALAVGVIEGNRFGIRTSPDPPEPAR